jgi:5-hydroxyisourate hydrolase-like protein (transthyretin family)
MESDNDSNTALIESLRKHMEQKDLDLLNIKAEKEDLLKALEKEKVKCEKLHVQMMENEGKSKSHTEVMLQQIEMESLELTELKSENLKLSDDVKILTDENSKLSKTLTQAMKEKETSHVEMEILRSEIEMLEHNKLEIETQVKDNRNQDPFVPCVSLNFQLKQYYCHYHSPYFC